jgi:hypothetical protein
MLVHALAVLNIYRERWAARASVVPAAAVVKPGLQSAGAECSAAWGVLRCPGLRATAYRQLNREWRAQSPSSSLLVLALPAAENEGPCASIAWA